MYKIINGIPVKFKERYIKMNGKIYANPTAEQLKNAGYKPLVLSDMPEDREGYYSVDTYKETDNEIVQVWEEHKILEEVEGQ